VPELIDPKIPDWSRDLIPIFRIVLLLIKYPSSKKTPTIATKDIGKGNNLDIAKLIPIDIPIQIS
jgi:hypothetical protein